MRTWAALVMSGLQSAAPADGRHSPPEDTMGPDDALAAALTEFDIAAVDENTPDRWCVFFHSAAERDRALAVLREAFPQLTMNPAEVVDEDWAARSQAGLRAVRIRSIVVAPPWDVPSEAGTIITILPSTGFGTGHHATTRLCLAALQGLDLRGRTVIDVGTGSGVLAIAASRLGAARVLAIDDDPDAIDAARANLLLNPGAEVSLQVGDFRRETLPAAAEVVLCNLTGGLLVSSARALQRLTCPGGRLILSGFTEREETGVLAAYPQCAIEHRAQEDEWICIRLRS